MRLIKLTAAVTVAFLLSSCASDLATQSIEFNYKVENANAAGIVQVFDMTGNTVVQIRDIDSKSPLFLDEKQREIKYDIVGQTAVLTGTHQTFTVVAGMTSSKVTRISNGKLSVASTKVMNGASQAIVPATSTPAPAEPEMMAQLSALKAELQALRKQLAASAGEQAAQHEKAQRYAAVASSKPASSVRIQFKDNSSAFEPKPEVASTLIELTKEASEIAITGYTDSAKPTQGSMKLAKARAAAAGQYLVRHGIDKSKIRISFLPAGGFLADNTTREGRDQNRRVEIRVL